MSRTKQAARILAQVEAEMRPFNQRAEDRAQEAWRALDRFTCLSAADLRANLRALLEIRDMVDRALDATIPDRGGDE